MSTSKTCYDPAGRASTLYTACGSSSGNEAVLCCRTGWTCMPNNLCAYTEKDMTIPQGTWERGLCTDKTFASPNCPQFCLNGDYTQNRNLIKNCGNGTGCCKTGNDCSCDVGQPGALLIQLEAVVSYTAVPTSPYTALVSGIAISVVTPVPLPTSRPSSSDSPSPSSTTSTAPLSVAAVPTSSSTSSGSESSSGSSSSTIATTSSPSATRSTSSAPTTATSAAVGTTSSATIHADSSSGISDLGVKIGVPIGIIAVIAGLLIAFFFFRRHSRRESRFRSSTSSDLLPKGGLPPAWRSSTAPTPQYSTLPQTPADIKKPLPQDDWKQPVYHEWRRPGSYDGKISVPPIQSSSEKILYVPQEMYELAGRDDQFRHELGDSSRFGGSSMF